MQCASSSLVAAVGGLVGAAARRASVPGKKPFCQLASLMVASPKAWESKSSRVFRAPVSDDKAAAIGKPLPALKDGSEVSVSELTQRDISDLGDFYKSFYETREGEDSLFAAARCGEPEMHGSVEGLPERFAYEAQLSLKSDSNRRVVIARARDVIVAAGTITDLDKEVCSAELLLVHTEHRGRQLGKHIKLKQFEIAEKRNCEYMKPNPWSADRPKVASAYQAAAEESGREWEKADDGIRVKLKR
jgi:hypothetical protein